MSTIPAGPHESAYELFDRWLEHWQRESHPLPTGDEPAAAAAPPTQEAGTSPLPVSPAAAAPHPRTSPEDEDSGLMVLRALTEHAVRMTDPWGPPADDPAPDHEPQHVRPVGSERQAGGAILRFPGRVVPTPRPSLTAPWAIPPTAVPCEERLAVFEEPARPPGLIVFSTRAGLRPLMTAAAATGAALTVLWVLVAMLLPTSTTLGVAAALAVLTGLLWSARMRATGTAVTIEDGVLKVVRGQSRHQFPLTGVHPPIDIVGEPGDRGWRVLIQRRGMRPFVVDGGMVDPFEFTDAIHRFRPRA
jgi:hypothetical protein